MNVRKSDKTRALTVFELEDWTVEAECNRLLRGAEVVHLEPKAMDLLLCLVDHAGQVVPRRALVDRVWATEFITDSTLTHTVADLRRALGDNPRSPSFIETIPKRGYRLVAEVRISEAAPERSAGAPSVVGHRPLAVVAGDRVVLGGIAAGNGGDHYLICGRREIPLAPPFVVFGRTSDVEIQVLAPEVSRRHARIDLADGSAIIDDLGSKNGTTVNDRLIEGPRRLISGDVIGLGPASLIYCHASNDPTRTEPAG